MIWSPLSQGVEQHYKLEAHNVIDKGVCDWERAKKDFISNFSRFCLCFSCLSPHMHLIFTFFFCLGADLVSGDGIYSRYLTQYHGAGRYRFDISVHDNHHQAFTVRSSFRSSNGSINNPKTNCCGSIVHISVEDQIPTGAFNRKTKGAYYVSKRNQNP